MAAAPRGPTVPPTELATLQRRFERASIGALCHLFEDEDLRSENLKLRTALRVRTQQLLSLCSLVAPSWKANQNDDPCDFSTTGPLHPKIMQLLKDCSTRIHELEQACEQLQEENERLMTQVSAHTPPPIPAVPTAQSPPAVLLRNRIQSALSTAPPTEPPVTVSDTSTFIPPSAEETPTDAPMVVDEPPQALPPQVPSQPSLDATAPATSLPPTTTMHSGVSQHESPNVQATYTYSSATVADEASAPPQPPLSAAAQAGPVISTTSQAVTRPTTAALPLPSHPPISSPIGPTVSTASEPLTKPASIAHAAPPPTSILAPTSTPAIAPVVSAPTASTVASTISGREATSTTPTPSVPKSRRESVGSTSQQATPMDVDQPVEPKLPPSLPPRPASSKPRPISTPVLTSTSTSAAAPVPNPTVSPPTPAQKPVSTSHTLPVKPTHPSVPPPRASAAAKLTESSVPVSSASNLSTWQPPWKQEVAATALPSTAPSSGARSVASTLVPQLKRKQTDSQSPSSQTPPAITSATTNAVSPPKLRWKLVDPSPAPAASTRTTTTTDPLAHGPNGEPPQKKRAKPVPLGESPASTVPEPAREESPEIQILEAPPPPKPRATVRKSASVNSPLVPKLASQAARKHVKPTPAVIIVTDSRPVTPEPAQPLPTSSTEVQPALSATAESPKLEPTTPTTANPAPAAIARPSSAAAGAAKPSPPIMAKPAPSSVAEEVSSASSALPSLTPAASNTSAPATSTSSKSDSNPTTSSAQPNCECSSKPPTVTPAETEELRALKEPDRCRRWLRMTCTSNKSGAILQKDIWDTYRDHIKSSTLPSILKPQPRPVFDVMIQPDMFPGTKFVKRGEDTKFFAEGVAWKVKECTCGKEKR